MTNLFKKLMLVAVAAMAFTACSQDVNEVNKVEKVTRYEFTANIADDTRSGFAEKEEGATAYKSEWYGDETLKIFVADNNGYNVETTATVDAKGNFDLELTDAPESFFITVVSPAESWVSEYTANIPTEQTPLANSVDPKAHLLQAQAVPVSGGVADINMNHMAAYGKMTVNAPEGFVIDNVVINLVGTFFGYDREYTYTINADNVDNNTFWFATEPIDVAEFTVTAYDAEGKAVAKTVDVAEAGKTMSFAYGRVGTFSVSDLKAVVAPEEPKALVFTSAKWVNNSYSDKLVQFYTEDGGTLQLNWYNCGSDAWIVPNTYGFANSGAIYYGGEYSWYENTTAGIDAEICTGTVVVSVVDGQYYIEFKNLADWDGNVYIENATFTGLISGLQVPDMRTKLATPDASATVDGKTISISWGAVEGADGYRVKLYSPYDEYFEEIVNTTEYVYEAQLYNTSYSFTIMSYANDENVTYKSSDDEYVDVVTGKDPNGPIAEYMSTDLYFNGDGDLIFVVDAYETFKVKLNSADRPDNTTIKNGNYTAVGSSTVGVGQFSVYQKVIGGFAEGWSSTKTTSTMSVKYVDGEYVIVVNYIGKWGGSGEVGYKGVPEGWVVPGEGGEGGEGGDEPVDPTPDPEQPGDGNVLGSETNPYTFSSVTKGQWTIEFSGAENGDRIVMDCNTTNVDSWIGDHGADTWIPMTKLLFGSGASIYGYNGNDYINSAFWSYSSVKVVKSGSTYTLTFKLGISSSTHTYYTYTGAI